jgi:hypothetical protein
VPPEEEAKLLADQEERATSKNQRVIRDAEDQVAWLVFKKGTTAKDPPDNKTNNISTIRYGSGATGATTQVFKYNFFLGRTAETTLIATIPVTTATTLVLSRALYTLLNT